MTRNPKVLGILISIVAIGMSSFHLYTAYFGSLEGMLQRSVHLLFALVLIFLIYPIRKKGFSKLDHSRWIFIVVSVMSILYIFINYDRITTRWWGVSEVYTLDILFGFALILLILEATRRSLGLPLVFVAVAFLLYGFYGSSMPGVFSHRGYAMDRVVENLYLTTSGIFGVALSASATFVFLFVLFGAFLENTKAGQFYIDLAIGSTGGMRGGPAKSAVVASGLMGSISGTAIGNVVTTGSLTIPLMKKTGYKPHEAAAIESSASVGGQVTPPIMGAAAFIVAEFTGVPYWEILLISIIPAFLYYAYVMFTVHFSAGYKGLSGLSKEELPKVKETIKEGWHLTIPLILLVYLLIDGYTPIFAGFIGIMSILVITNLRKNTRMSLQAFANSLIGGAKQSLPIVAATACAGIVVGIISLTGLGMKFSSIVVSMSGGNLFMALIFVAIAALILGMGLPVIAAYVVLAVMAAPALAELGVPILVAHLVVLWFTQLSNITPPVCLTAYAGAAIAKANPIQTGFHSLRFALAMIILPFMFVYSPLLITGSKVAVTVTIVATLAGFIALSAAIEGFLKTKINMLARTLLFISALFLFYQDYLLNVVGLLIVITILILQIKGAKQLVFIDKEQANISQ
ncbi:TRAP transporter permease [Salirhabdus salicampi]|uniref:TRAP transporter permease n=1 Tax=Salirhabdus salicampi TaxID=476102 RepID=UPI0020C21E52|nr:TRAP transporter permease [Salirhabdus salicampi]MCP8615829.1 TRAP transporter permease [Salirhabdus salicampi]